MCARLKESKKREKENVKNARKHERENESTGEAGRERKRTNVHASSLEQREIKRIKKG